MILEEPGSYPLPPLRTFILVIAPVLVIPSAGTMKAAPEPPVGFI